MDKKQKQLSWNEATEKIGIPSGDDLQPAGYKIITCISYIFPGCLCKESRTIIELIKVIVSNDL